MNKTVNKQVNRIKIHPSRTCLNKHGKNCSLVDSTKTVVVQSTESMDTKHLKFEQDKEWSNFPGIISSCLTRKDTFRHPKFPNPQFKQGYVCKQRGKRILSCSISVGIFVRVMLGKNNYGNFLLIVKTICIRKAKHFH